MNDELMDRAIENIKNLTTQMEPILKEMAQKVIHLCIELGLIKPRHRYHTKRVAVRKMQLRRLRHER